MKTSNRVRSKTTTNRIPSQVQPPAQPGICRQARDAFIELDNAARAAIALAMLNASHIERSLKEQGGWEDFELSSFSAGNKLLPRLLADDFVSAFSPWQDAMLNMAENIEGGHLAGLTEPEARGEVEHSIHAICHLLVLQDDEIDQRMKGGAYGCHMIINGRLESAFSRALRAYAALASETEETKRFDDPPAPEDAAPRPAIERGALRPLSREEIITEIEGQIESIVSANFERGDGRVHDIDMLETISALEAAIEIVKSN